MKIKSSKKGDHTFDSKKEIQKGMGLEKNVDKKIQTPPQFSNFDFKSSTF